MGVRWPGVDSSERVDKTDLPKKRNGCSRLRVHKPDVARMAPEEVVLITGDVQYEINTGVRPAVSGHGGKWGGMTAGS